MMNTMPHKETTTIITTVSLYNFVPFLSIRRYWKSKASLIKDVDTLYIPLIT